MNAREIIIIGCNGNCVDIAEAVEALAAHGGAVKVAGFLDDADGMQGAEVAGYPVLGRIADAAKFAGAGFVNGIGSPKSYRFKADIIARAGVPVERWATVIHPTAVVSRHARIGRGTVLLANVSVGAGARIGDHCMVLQNSVISHDSTIGDCSALATGVCVSGGCAIGENCYIGGNVSIRDGVRIAPGSLIGIGAVVVKDVAAVCVAFGNPARPRA
ncbi:MAG: NeuD/PglB/VioB family sugar acetyltransferase [Verrucomicrobiaceae bacterium]|nr:NeuD/PglB/VioB family sugar acetyltransferase [Verrucomicrobiaceae bacterium]